MINIVLNESKTNAVFQKTINLYGLPNENMFLFYYKRTIRKIYTKKETNIMFGKRAWV